MGPVASCGTIPARMRDHVAEKLDFESAVQQFRPKIFRFALASLRDLDDAESVTQDCFLKAHRAWAQFRGDASVQTWLMQIAVNLVRDVGRNRRFQFWKRARAGAVDVDSAGNWLPDAGLSPEEQVAERQRLEAIWSSLANLSECQRTVFLLHFMEEMNAAEIARATGIARGAVKVHLFRAVRAVRQRVGKMQ
jgi:RNA polymerase sigma-70 factor (ECF subfamily)